MSVTNSFDDSNLSLPVVAPNPFLHDSNAVKSPIRVNTLRRTDSDNVLLAKNKHAEKKDELRVLPDRGGNPFSLDGEKEKFASPVSESAAAGRGGLTSIKEVKREEKDDPGSGNPDSTENNNPNFESKGDAQGEIKDKKATRTSGTENAAAPEKVLTAPPKEKVEEKIRKAMMSVIKTVEVSDKAQGTCLEKEEMYWEGQQAAFDRLLERVYLGEKTLRELATLMKNQQKAAAQTLKYLHLNGGWERFGKDEGEAVKAVCQTQSRLLEGMKEYSEKMQAQVYDKTIEEALTFAKEISVFAIKIKKEASKVQKAMRYQRDATNKRWALYRSACERRQRNFEQARSVRASDDPYLTFEQYKREVISLHRKQASYNSVMGQIMAEFETREMTRSRHLRNLMLRMISAQKDYFDHAALTCTQAVGKLGGINLESDLLTFRHTGGLLHNPGVVDIKFKPEPIGLDFKGNRISHVREGSQASARGVKVGWRILEINGKLAPAGHNQIASLLETLKKAGGSILIRFGTKPPSIVFDLPPPQRKTKHIQILSNAECSTVGDLSRMSKTMGFTTWTKMYCVITNSGIFHVLNDSEATSPHSSIKLHQAVLRLAPKIDPHAFEIEETTSGFFGSGIKV